MRRVDLCFFLITGRLRTPRGKQIKFFEMMIHSVNYNYKERWASLHCIHLTVSHHSWTTLSHSSSCEFGEVELFKSSVQSFQWAVSHDSVFLFTPSVPRPHESWQQAAKTRPDCTSLWRHGYSRCILIKIYQVNGCINPVGKATAPICFNAAPLFTRSCEQTNHCDANSGAAISLYSLLPHTHYFSRSS